MKYGTQLGSLGKSDRSEALQYARELGCEGLEVSMPIADLRTDKIELKDLLKQAEEIQSDFSKAEMDFISLTPNLLLKHVQTPEVVKAVCDISKVLGVRTIRMFSAPHVRWGGPGSQLDEWMSDYDGERDGRTWLKQNTEELSKLLDLSDGYDLRYVFELHHGYVINSASAAMRLLEPFPASKVGILMDPGNMVFEGNEGWRNSVQFMREYLAYIHCKNGAYRQQEGKWIKAWDSLMDGIADYAELVTALKDIDFKGYLSIEDLRGGVSREEAIGQGIAYLKGLVESSERVMPA